MSYSKSVMLVAGISNLEKANIFLPNYSEIPNSCFFFLSQILPNQLSSIT